MSGKRKANEELSGSSRPSPSQPRWDTGERSVMEIPDSERSSLCLRHVRALNRDFTSWVQEQSEQHPDELWTEGVQDYVKYATKLMEDFKDVVEWLRFKNKSESKSLNGEGEPNGKVASSAERGVPVVTGSRSSPVFPTSPVGTLAAGSQKPPFPGLGLSSATGQSKAASLLGPGLSGSGGASGRATENSSRTAASSGVTGAASESGNTERASGHGPLAETNAGLGNGLDASSGAPAGWATRPSRASAGDDARTEPGEQAGPNAGSQKGHTAELGRQLPAGRATDSSKLFVGTSLVSPSSDPAGSGSGLVACMCTVPSVSSTFGSSTSWLPTSFASSPSAGGAPIFGMPSIARSDATLPGIATSMPLSVGPSSQSAVRPFSLAFKDGPKTTTAGQCKEDGSKEEAGDDADDEGKDEQENEGPSVQPLKEEGVTTVDSRKAVLLRMDPVSKSWRNLGSGTLSIRRQSDAPPATKAANPTILFRNDIGKLLLNARIYANIKTALRKEGVVVTLFNAVEIGSVGKGSGSQVNQEGNGQQKDGAGTSPLAPSLFIIKVAPQEAVKELSDIICANAPAD